MSTNTTPIVVATPEANTAEAWNTNIREAADKAGVEIPAALRITEVPPAKKDDQPVIYQTTINVNGKEMTFSDADPTNVLKQVTAAYEAAQPAPAAAAPVVEEKKPAFTEAELFDIQLGLQKGDPTVLENFVLKSGMLSRYLESEGINIADLKKQTTEHKSDSLVNKWKEATDAFNAKVKAGEIDYPGGEQNTQLMGFMLASLNLGNKPSVESFEAAYAEMKKRNLVFSPTAKAAEVTTAAAEIPGARKAPSSTAVGTHGGKQEVTPQAGAPTGKVELDMTTLTPRQYTDSWNQLINLGYKPEQIVIKR